MSSLTATDFMEAFDLDLGWEMFPDVLIPEFGTDGTLIYITFSTEKSFLPNQKANFLCQNHVLPPIVQDAALLSNSALIVPFLEVSALKGIRMAVFAVSVPGAVHSPLQFIWVGPSTLEALEYIKTRGFFNQHDDDYNDYGICHLPFDLSFVQVY